jgi:aldose sugar dehydrogenase
MTRHTLLALTTVVVLGLSSAVLDGHSANRGDAPMLTRTVVLDGREDPWDLAFTPDGALLFTEKCRGLSVRRPAGSRHHLFGRDGAAVAAPDFFCKGQSGAHGIAVDPEFARTRVVYLYMPSTLSSPPTNRVVRLVVDPGYTTVSARTDIVPDIPFKHAANAVGGAGLHSGGRLRFGPEGFLYITTGDNHQPTLPQDLTRLGGNPFNMCPDLAKLSSHLRTYPYLAWR